MNLSLRGRTALVTGASSGIGAQAAMALAEAGARVALVARRRDRLEQLRASLASRGSDAFAIALDVTQVATIETVTDRIEREFGPIDVLVNNAGVGRPRRLVDYVEGDFQHIVDVNLKGAFFIAQAVAKRMLARGRGHIINVSSAAALKPTVGIGLYAMSKAALNHMTRQMALEWGPSGLNVNAICPGYVTTALNEAYWSTEAGRRMIAGLPRRRVAKPADLDALFIYLASDASEFVNGAIIPADDGLSVT